MESGGLFFIEKLLNKWRVFVPPQCCRACSFSRLDGDFRLSGIFRRARNAEVGNGREQEPGSVPAAAELAGQPRAVSPASDFAISLRPHRVFVLQVDELQILGQDALAVKMEVIRQEMEHSFQIEFPSTFPCTFYFCFHNYLFLDSL